MMWGSAGQRLCVCIDGVGEREGRGQVRLSGLVRSRLLIFAASMLVGPWQSLGRSRPRACYHRQASAGCRRGTVGILPSTSTCAMF